MPSRAQREEIIAILITTNTTIGPVKLDSRSRNRMIGIIDNISWNKICYNPNVTTDPKTYL